MKVKITDQDTGLRYVSKVTWYGEGYDEDDDCTLSGKVLIDITKDFHYAHPSGDCEVLLRRGAGMSLFVVREMHYEHGVPWLWADGLYTSDEHVDECLAWNNCSLPVDGDMDEALQKLIRHTLNILLMHAVNYDGCDGTIYNIGRAEAHYGCFGIEYLKHATEREEVCA